MAEQRSDVRCQCFGHEEPTAQVNSRSDDRVWVEAELKDVGEQALMRGLDTAFPIMRPGLFLSYCGRRTMPATKRLTDVPLPLSGLRPCARCKFAAVTYVLIACASCNSPHEAGQFSGNCGTNHRRPFSPRDQQAISSRQPALRLPRDLPDCRWRFLQAG